MATTVCVNGCAFDVDNEGRLTLKIDGAPNNHAWPAVHGSTPEDCNPLRCDPDGGLWVPPPADSRLDAGTSEDGGQTTFVDSDGATLVTHTLLTHSDEVVNPSDCLNAIALCQVAVDIRYKYETGGGADSQIIATLEWDSGDGYGAADTIYSDTVGLRDLTSPLTAFIKGTRETELEFTRFVTGLNPGETRTVKARVKAQGSDDIVVTKCVVQVRSLAVTQA